MLQILIRRHILKLKLNLVSNAAFTLYGIDDQERKLTFVKIDFHVFKLKFYACNFKQPLYPLILLELENTKILLYKLFVRYLVIKPACVNAAMN